MITVHDLIKETNMSRVVVHNAVRKLGIPPVITKPRRYLLNDRQAETVRNLLRQWKRGKRPRSGGKKS